MNGGPATVQALRRIGERLVDFHGPHDNQSLLDPAFQLDALDSFGACAAARAAYAGRWDALKALRERAAALQGGDEGAVEREIDLLRYQVREIEEAALDPEADGDALRDEYTAACNAARILELGSGACAALSDADGNAVADVQLNTVGAAALINWLLSEEGQELAANYGFEQYGEYLFYLKDGRPVRCRYQMPMHYTGN